MHLRCLEKSPQGSGANGVGPLGLVLSKYPRPKVFYDNNITSSGDRRLANGRKVSYIQELSGNPSRTVTHVRRRNRCEVQRLEPPRTLKSQSDEVLSLLRVRGYPGRPPSSRFG